MANETVKEMIAILNKPTCNHFSVLAVCPHCEMIERIARGESLLTGKIVEKEMSKVTVGIFPQTTFTSVELNVNQDKQRVDKIILSGNFGRDFETFIQSIVDELVKQHKTTQIDRQVVVSCEGEVIGEKKL